MANLSMPICSIALILDDGKYVTRVHFHDTGSLGCEPSDLQKAAEIALQVEKLWVATEVEGMA